MDAPDHRSARGREDQTRALNFALDFARGPSSGSTMPRMRRTPTRSTGSWPGSPKPAARHTCKGCSTITTRAQTGSAAVSPSNTPHGSASSCRAWKDGLRRAAGGTTLFFRRGVLEQLGGWDAHNVTEDADLGVRLARLGYTTELVETVTKEEANCRVWPWIKQRSRWIKGYAMTYGVHMRDPRRLWRELGRAGSGACRSCSSAPCRT